MLHIQIHLVKPHPGLIFRPLLLSPIERGFEADDLHISPFREEARQTIVDAC